MALPEAGNLNDSWRESSVHLSFELAMCDVIPALFRIAFRRLIWLTSALVYSLVCDTITEQEMIRLQNYMLLNRGHFHCYCHSMRCDDSNIYVNVFDSVKICCPSSNTIRLQEIFLDSNRMRWKNFSIIECKASTEVILCPNSIRWKNFSVIECKASTEGWCNWISYGKKKAVCKAMTEELSSVTRWNVFLVAM